MYFDIYYSIVTFCPKAILYMNNTYMLCGVNYFMYYKYNFDKVDENMCSNFVHSTNLKINKINC